jgi:hypothetical protein
MPCRRSDILATARGAFVEAHGCRPNASRQRPAAFHDDFIDGVRVRSGEGGRSLHRSVPVSCTLPGKRLHRNVQYGRERLMGAHDSKTEGENDRV